MFIGYSFLGDSTCVFSTPTAEVNFATITVKKSIVNDLYVSETFIDKTDFSGVIPTTWDLHTRLHAYFKNDLYGGNVNFTEDIVSSIRIKRKTSKDSKFKTIYEKEVSSKDDFTIDIMHYYAPVGDISFAYVPVISGGEGDYIINTVKSNFNSYFICESDTSYPMILDTNFSKKLVQRTAIIEPLGREKPIIVKGGLTKYYTGDIECCFIELNNNSNTDCQWKVDTSWDYRNTIYDFLLNGNVKILKDFLGNEWMVSVSSDEISEDSDYYKHITTKFSVTECGDAYSTSDLYYNGLIDTNLDG